MEIVIEKKETTKMSKYDRVKNSMGEKNPNYKHITKEEIEELYLKRKLSFREISVIKNCSPPTIKNKCTYYNIKVRKEWYSGCQNEKNPKWNNNIKKKDIETLLINKKLCRAAAAKKLGIGVTALQKRINLWNIKVINKYGYKGSPGSKNGAYGKVFYAKAKFSNFLGHHFRSEWEWEFGSLMIKYNIKYIYEKNSFKVGNNTYTPDFFLMNGAIIEVKGYCFPKNIQKMLDFIKIYPKKLYIVITSKDNKKWFKNFKNVIYLFNSNGRIVETESTKLLKLLEKHNNETD